MCHLALAHWIVRCLTNIAGDRPDVAGDGVSYAVIRVVAHVTGPSGGSIQ